jgi:cytochrome b561
MEQLIAEERYDRVTIWLHWITVALVAVLWAIGLTGDLVPRGPWRTGVWSTHVMLGFLVVLVLLTRIAWRTRYGRVLPPPPDPPVLKALATGTHYLLYVLLAAVVITGLANASYRGFKLFGAWPVPQFGSGVAATRRSINHWHELAAHATVIVALLHACAALVHHYVWHDQVLRRMRP